MPETTVDVLRKTYVQPLWENQRPDVLSAEGTGTEPTTGKKAGSDLPPPGGKRKKVSQEQTQILPEEPQEG